MTRRSGFTLVELLISVGLFLMAITVALAATIGSNNLIVRAEARSTVVEGARAVADILRRETVDTTTDNILLEQNGEIIVIKQFRVDQGKNVCVRVGRAHFNYDSALGLESYNFAPAAGTKKETIAYVIYQIDQITSDCPAITATNQIIYQGRLVDQKAEAMNFVANLVRDAECQGANKCGLLRYSLRLQEAAIKQSAINESRLARLEITTSLPIGVGE